LNRLLAYWEGKRRPDGGLPCRADIDPLEMRFALGHLVLTDVEPGAPPRFRLRLVGSNVAERMGYDPTGRYLDEDATALAARAAEAYRRVLETRAPVEQTIEGVFGERYLAIDILRLPLAEDGRRVNMILSAVYFRRAP
jgi:hypothetical protein